MLTYVFAFVLPIFSELCWQRWRSMKMAGPSWCLSTLSSFHLTRSSSNNPWTSPPSGTNSGIPSESCRLEQSVLIRVVYIWIEALIQTHAELLESWPFLDLSFLCLQGTLQEIQLLKCCKYSTCILTMRVSLPLADTKIARSLLLMFDLSLITVRPSMRTTQLWGKLDMGWGSILRHAGQNFVRITASGAPHCAKIMASGTSAVPKLQLVTPCTDCEFQLVAPPTVLELQLVVPPYCARMQLVLWCRWVILAKCCQHLVVQIWWTVRLRSWAYHAP